MRNIIYRSENIIPWDTQSAFKMTSYNVSCEENMIFCYLKGYVNRGDLVLCSYCFTEKPSETANMHMFINLTPQQPGAVMRIDYGFGGIQGAVMQGVDFADRVKFSAFKADDEQGFYWCGELRIPAQAVKDIWGTILDETSILTLNMTQTFPDGGTASLFGNAEEQSYNPRDNMAAFVVLNY